MDILLALLPAIAWGSMILVTTYVGGTAYHQILGITFGALIFALIQTILGGSFELDTTTIWVGLASGAFWTMGQIGQLQSIKKIGVAYTMPMSTGMQLVSTTLFGALILGEWNNLKTTGLGITALILILAGVYFTSAQPDSVEVNQADQSKRNQALIMLGISTLGYLLYAVLAAFFKIDGSKAVLPQSVGMVLTALLVTAKTKPYDMTAIKNILPGLVWAFGSFFMFLSQPKVGVSVSFSLSQTSIVISALGSIFILKDSKTPRQIKKIIIGIILIIAAAALLGISKAG